MTVVNPKSISGINSITMASGSDNLLTIHTTNTTERVRVNSDGDVIVGSGITVSPDGDIFATGVTTSTTFVGALTGNVTGNATGLSGTPNISAGTIAGSTGTFSSGIDVTSDVTISDAIVHSGDTDTKIRFPAVDTITAETGGSERLRITSAGLVGVNETPTIAQFQVKSSQLGGTSGNTQEVVRLHSPDVSNTTSYRFTNYRTENGTSHTSSELRFRRHVDSTDMGYFGLGDGALTFGYGTTEKMRLTSSGQLLMGTTSTSGISAGSDDIVIGSIGDSTVRGITFATTDYAAIRWADAGDNAMGRIQYSNSTDVMSFHTLNTKRLSLDSDGMKFGSDTAAANALDDYEEGTFSFTLANVNAPSFEAQGGTYVKIGRYVFGHGTIGVASGLDTSDGSGFQPSGLPFTATGEIAVTLGRYTNLLGGKAGSFRNVRNTGTGFILQEGSDSNIAYNECNSSGYLNFTFAYYTTS